MGDPTNRIDARLNLIRKLSEARGGRALVTYVTSTRPGMDAPIAKDAVPIIHQHLRELKLSRDKDRLDLFLHTNGGDGVVPWRLMSLLREFAQEVAVLVPHSCRSAGTLMALGADEVVMHPMGELGPTDPTSLTEFNPAHPLDQSTQVGVDVEDVAAYVDLVKEDVGIKDQEELMLAFTLLVNSVHPLALGNVKRLASQMEMMCKKMLAQRCGSPHKGEADRIVRLLNRELFYHGHPINRNEARDELGLSFVTDATPEVEKAMWDLYCAYVADMSLDQEFDMFAEAANKEGGLPAPPPWTESGSIPPPTVSSMTVCGAPYVFVESTARSDHREIDWDITLSRQWDGELDARMVITGTRWKSERSSG